MPNWCYNNLTIDGTRENISEFLTAITSDLPEGGFDLTIPFPCPEELQITARFLTPDDSNDDEETKALRQQYTTNKEKYGATNWYDWQIENWGTKWSPDIDDLDVQDDGKRIWARFDSAWAPPSQLIQKLSGLFPTLQFVISYEEGGMCFAGAEGFYAGEMVYNGYFQYDSIPILNVIQEKLDNLPEGTEEDDVWDEYNEALRTIIDQRWDEADCVVAEKAKATL
jgi:hypothetical protein